MFPVVKREYSQFLSILAMIAGAYCLFIDNIIAGCIFVGWACWIMLMNESLLLSKVQSEMYIALENLSRKREEEIQDLLFFLQKMKSLQTPWDSVDNAKAYISKIGFPACVSGSDGYMIDANITLLNVLGYEKKEFLETPVSMFHNKELYGKYVQGISSKVMAKEKFMHSRFAFVSKAGIEVRGSVAVIILPNRSGAVGIFLPDNSGIISNLDGENK